jgi:phytoene/squalene synthetase
MELFDKNALDCSKKTTLNYSTSFSLGISMLDKKRRPGIYAIYGYVRYADEIVDTLHQYDKVSLFNEFRADTYHAFENKISTNPIIHSFQWVVNKYQIDRKLVDAFLDSMEKDLYESSYSRVGYDEYIYGSAEVVGLMCLHIFLPHDSQQYHDLKHHASCLGQAFQKVNFLRDMKDDFVGKGRVYFPGVDFSDFTEEQKANIEAEILHDFRCSLVGVKGLPKDVRFGVYLAYVYYLKLLNKIGKTPANELIHKRIRVSNPMKIWLLVFCYFRNKFNIL